LKTDFHGSAVNPKLETIKSVQNGGPLLSSPASATSTTFKNGQPTPPPTNEPPKPPKKGSFAEIMARGKAAQTTLGQVGKIQHKKIEKLPSRREREEMKGKMGKNIRNGLAPNSKFQKIGQHPIRDGRNGTRETGKVGSQGKAAPEPEKKIKKAALATTGYAGTARPKPGAKAPSRPVASSSSRDRYRSERRGASYGYASEEEEEEDEEEEQDYESDVSSDMEAAAFEVDEEEELAARIARKEDAEALAEENRLKREKAEKKRRLMAMAKKARH